MPIFKYVTSRDDVYRDVWVKEGKKENFNRVGWKENGNKIK